MAEHGENVRASVKNYCRSCKQDFAGITLFDAHRIGKHEYLWSPEREDGRRCLEIDEMLERGWSRDKWNRWHGPPPERSLSHWRKPTEGLRGVR